MERAECGADISLRSSFSSVCVCVDRGFLVFYLRVGPQVPETTVG